MALSNDDIKKCQTFLLNASDDQLKSTAEWFKICVEGKNTNVGQYLWDQMEGDNRMLKELLDFINEKYESSTPVQDALSPKVKGAVNTADKVAKWTKTELKDEHGDTYTVGPEAEDVSIEAGRSYQFQNTKFSSGKGDYSEASHMPGFYEVGMVKPAERESNQYNPVDYDQLHLYHFEDFTDEDYGVILKDNEKLFNTLISESHVAPAVKDLIHKWYEANKHSKAYHRYLDQLLSY